jgi:hypothetical protein
VTADSATAAAAAADDDADVLTVPLPALQALYDDLRQAYPAPQRPSGLTLVDNVGAVSGEESWCARSLASFAA